MTDTLLTVACEENVTCTALGVQPGATIVSPILLSLSGVTGQIWALYYLYTSTRPQHSRTVFFVLLSTLIWTDLVGKVITTTPALVAYAHGTWVGGVPMCNLHGFSMTLISLVTHLLVSTMAVERFIGIRHGYFYNKNITTSRTKMLLLGMWLFSVLFCALPLFGVGQYALQYPGSWCYVNIHVGSATPLRHRIFTNVFGSFTLASLLVMVVCNLVVIIVLLEKTLSRRRGFCAATLLCLRLCRERCCSTNQLCAPHRASRQRELEMQMVVVLLVITIVFVLSWSPIDMRLFLNQIWPHHTREDHIQDLIAVRLTSINQIVDPWAYIICRKVFMMRAWRWMRLSLMGSRLERLGGRETSSRPLGSQKKAAPTPARSSERYRYRTPFRGSGGGAELDMGVSVVAMEEEVDAHHHHHLHHHHHHNHHHSPLSPPPAVPPSPTPPLSKESLTRELQPKDVVEIFKDSGTGSNITPSTFCSDSGEEGICNHSCLAAAAAAGGGGGRRGMLGAEPLQQEAVPIPVFTCGQYRVVPPGDPRLPRRLKRITSSASARAATTSRPPRHTPNPEDTGRESWLPLVVKGRRHSWCCPLDDLETKQYRTQSTQTFRNHDMDDQDEHDDHHPPRADCVQNDDCCSQNRDDCASCHHRRNHHHHHHHHDHNRHLDDRSKHPLRDEYVPCSNHDYCHNHNHNQQHDLDDHASFPHHNHGPQYYHDPTLRRHSGKQRDVRTCAQDDPLNDQDDSVFIITSGPTCLKNDVEYLGHKSNGDFSFISNASTSRHRGLEELC